jgi:hypothetical protein
LAAVAQVLLAIALQEVQELTQYSQVSLLLAAVAVVHTLPIQFQVVLVVAVVTTPRLEQVELQTKVMQVELVLLTTGQVNQVELAAVAQVQ